MIRNLIITSFVAILLLAISSCNEPPREVMIESIKIVESKFAPYNGEIPRAGSDIELSSKTYPPRYSIRYDPELEGIYVDVEFFDEDTGMVDPKKLLGGWLYCVMTHADGEVVNFVFDIPPVKPRFMLNVPTSKLIGWKVAEPNLYSFSFIRDIRGVVDEQEMEFGFSRMTPLEPNPEIELPSWKYFRIEEDSLYIRGIFDRDAARLRGRGAERTFSEFKQNGFNLYVTNAPLTSEHLNVANEIGIMCAWVTDKPIRLQEDHPAHAVKSLDFFREPSVLGECVLEKDAYELIFGLQGGWSPEDPARFKGTEWKPQDVIEFVGTNGKSFDSLVIPPCDAGFSDAYDFISSGQTPSNLSGPERPMLLSMFSLGEEECPPPDTDLYRFINLVRSAEWCAGFIIPAEMFEKPSDAGLLTDDFLVIDLDGFPQVDILTVKRGSTIQIPIRLANFKVKGDQGGGIWWRWDESSDEGTAFYDELPYKGVHELPPLEIKVPDAPGEYNLRFEVIDAHYEVQAFNRLKVIVQ